MIDTGVIDAFNKAIDSELEAIRADGGRRIPLRHGKSLGADGYGNYYYSFRTNIEIGLPDDSPIEVSSSGESVPGAIVRVDGFRVLLALDSELPDTDYCELVVDPTFLLEGLKRSLAAVVVNPEKFNISLAEKLLDKTDEWVTIGSDSTSLPSDLNHEQQQAVKAALTQPVTYVWGPPGTGKTHTLATLISIYLRRDLKVLLLAHSNVAVDTVVYRLVQMKELSSFVIGRQIVRSGYPRIDEVKKHDSILALTIAEDRLPQVKRRRALLDKELREIETRVYSGQSSNQERARLSQLRQERRRLLEQIRKAEQEVIGEARLVATTLARSAVLEALSNYRFDAVVVDEASMAYIPHVYWAACLAIKHLVIAGDFRQLGPVVRSDSAAVQRWLGNDIFEVAGLIDKVEKRLEDKRLVGLRTQHRMHPAISRLVDRIYGWSLA